MTTGILNLDDVLALLEEQPMDSSAIAAILELSTGFVHKSLCAAERVKAVKRVGTRQLWARPDYVARIGAPPKVDVDACQAAILQAVASGPRPTQLLVATTGFPKYAIKHQCRLLLEAGRLKSIGNNRGAAWALPTWMPPAKPTNGAATRHAEELVKKGLRQPHERPPSVKVKVTDASWWCQPRTREEFSAAAAQRNAEMSATSAEWKRFSVKGLSLYE